MRIFWKHLPTSFEADNVSRFRASRMSLLSSNGLVVVGITWIGVLLVETGFVDAATVVDVDDELPAVDVGLFVDVVFDIVVDVDVVGAGGCTVIGRLVVVVL